MPKYTPLEIDQMRDLIRWTQRGSYTDETIERQLLTHITNGTSVKDLEAFKEQRALEGQREQMWLNASRDIERRLCSHPVWVDPWGDYLTDRYLKVPPPYSMPHGLHCAMCLQVDRRKKDRATTEESGKKTKGRKA